jgi:hypothetical protein
MAKGPIKGKSNRQTSINPNKNTGDGDYVSTWRNWDSFYHDDRDDRSRSGGRNRNTCSCHCEGGAFNSEMVIDEYCDSGQEQMSGCGPNFTCQCTCSGGPEKKQYSIW